MTTYKDNRSFVLRGIDDVVYEERPIPHGTLTSPAGVLDSDQASSLSSRGARGPRRGQEDWYVDYPP